jgi:ABC-type polysaccharide/polyol phosphate transport system ATPase subunit
MDEWLSAGDAQFLDKAEERVKKFVQSSSIMVLASHSTAIIEEWCTHALLLDQGRIQAIGPVEEILAAYDHLVASEELPFLETA